MMIRSKFFLKIAVLCAALFCWQHVAYAGIQISENFDSAASWGLPWGATYTNTATNATGWVVSNALILADALAPSPSNACRLQGDKAALVASPWISNGVGSVIFYSKIAAAGNANQIVVESSPSNGIWTTQGLTNSITTTAWTCFTNAVFSPTNLFMRLRKIDNSSALKVVYLDSISITYPPAAVSITNVTINPAAPMENDSITVTATLSINGSYPDTLNVTNYWKLSSSTNWTAIPMPSNQPNVFITVSNIPGQKAYSAIDYFAQSVMTADGFNLIANSATNTVAIRPRTGFTSMVVTNSLNSPLTLSANYQWQGVAYVSNALSTFKFSGTSNSINTLWGDSNQTISNQLAFGNADVGATDIILSTTNIGLHLFTFNESDFTYRIRPCVRENFETWTSQPFGTYTNLWILNNGSVTNDAAGSYSNNYATLNSNTTSYLLSPLLPNGIGHISFWYRKWGSPSASSGALSIQVASTPSSTNWTTIASVTNISLTTYSFVNIPWADLNNQAVRILNNTNAGNSGVSLDEVVISAPGASVAITNVTLNPVTPLENDSIAVTGILSMNGYLDSLTATNYWKLSTSTNWIAIPMTSNQPNAFITISNIPSQQAFTPIDYFVQAKPTIDGINAFVNSTTNTVIIRPRSGYTAMMVTNSVNAPLTLSSTYQWQGVAYVSNTLSTFKFSGTSNNISTLWGDSNQTISNQLAFGNADIGAGNIILSTTNIGFHLFTFNESDFTYRIRPCVRENFETWTSQPFGTYTNLNLWILNNGSVTNDAAGAYSNNYATLNSNSTSYLLSPLLSNGIGHISFWYRKWGSPSTSSGALSIQVASTPSSTNWTTIASVTNITSTIYSFVNIPWADLNNQAVRILNNTNAGNSGVSLDEVVISAPGASVAVTNVSLNPVIPLENDSIAITGMLSLNGYLDSLTATNFWKLSTSTNWTPIPMASNQPNAFITISNIPSQLAFTPIDYYVQANPTIDGINAFVNSITNTVIIRPRTSYATMMVTNSVNAPLTLSSAYQWQGVAYVSNTLSTFKFSGISNSINTLWGDSNQTVSNQLAFGNADIGAGNIVLSTTNIGLHLFTFNESDFTYRIRPCVRENLETWTNQSFGTYTNLSQWILNNGSVTNDAAGSYSNNYVTLNSNTTSYLLSPLLPNGIGHISFWYRKWGSPGGASGALNIQVAPTPSSTNWTTIASVTNISLTTYSFVNIPWADLNNQAVRILNNTNAGAPRVSLDEVVISAPGASVAITNMALNPTLPTGNDSISVSAMLALNGYLDALSATTYWKLSSSTGWANISMSLNPPATFTSISSISNQPTFASIDYYAQVNPTIDGITNSIISITNTVVIRPQSGYSSMVVTNSINTPLTLVANNQWQGVAYVSNTPAYFKYRGTSNGVSTLWGDSNQTISNLMAYGNGDIGATDVILTTTNIGLHLFTFNESDFTYSTRACVREDFETWTNQPFGNYTNLSQWILTNGAVTNDVSGTYSGRYAILNSNSTSYLLSPLLANGIGHISFWYRKTGSISASSGALSIQVAPTPASTNWTTIASLTNITSTAYYFVNIPWSDLNNQAVRFVNNTNSGDAQISLDEVIVATPGAAVYVSNLTPSPSTTGAANTVNIGIDLMPNTWATNLTNVMVWYRVDPNSLFQSLPMIQTSGNHFTTTNGIPPFVGTIQYAIAYNYAGIFGVSPTFYPAAGTNQPFNYTSTKAAIVNYRNESFDSTNSWGPLPWSTIQYTNTATNAITGWVLSNATIKSDSPSSPSMPYACILRGGMTALVASPLLSNGVGSVVFSSRDATSGALKNQIVVESSGTGLGGWTIGPTNNLLSTWTSFTNTILVPSNTYVRLRQLNTTNILSVAFLDSISCTPYPSDITITNINLNPGYPAVGQSVMISCDILSLNSQYPAFNLMPTLYWVPAGGNINAIPMVNTAGNTYTTSYPFSLTNVTHDVPVTNWVVCSFAGYHELPVEDLSPRSSVTSNFAVRAFASAFQNIGITVNGSSTNGLMLTNSIWQSIFNIQNTNSTLSLALQGYGYSTGNGISTDILTWGNSNNWQTTLPLADYAGNGQTAIILTNGNFTGQYLVRFNEATMEYYVQQCVWQDFEGWNPTTNYTLSGNSGLPAIKCNFDDWPTNYTQVRSEDFSNPYWNNYTSSYSTGTSPYPSPASPPFYQIYGALITNLGGVSVVQIQSNNLGVLNKRGWIAQLSTDPGQNTPLRGIGTISYTYRAATSNPPCTLGVYLFPTNEYLSETSYYDSPTKWVAITNHTPVTNASGNRTFFSNTIALNTNVTSDVIFSHDDGDQSVYFDNLSVSEWYADTKTNNDWIAYESWIETKPGGGNTCRFDPTRSTKTNQYIRSPLLNNGMDTLSFNYCSGNNTVGQSLTNTFEGWTTNSYGNYTNGNWIISNGCPTADVSRAFGGSTNSVWLNGTTGGTNSYIRSPQLVNGISNLTFYYRNWAPTNNAVPSGTLQIQGASSGNPENWISITNINNINSTNYVPASVSLPNPVYNYIKIVNNPYGSNATVCIDNIFLLEAPAVTVGRYVANTFETWTTPASYGNYNANGWALTNGQSAYNISCAYNGSTNAAWLNGALDGVTNAPISYLRSPYLYYGFQNVAFYYRYNGNYTNAGTLLVQIAPSDTPPSWTTIATISNITSTNYNLFSYNVASLTNHYMRIVSNPDGSNAPVCIDNITIEDFPYVSFEVQMSTDQNNWITLTNNAASFKGGTITDYHQFTLKMLTNLNMYVRINSKTPAPNILLVDDIAISQYSKGNGWIANNVFIDGTKPQNPPLPRQFYGGAGYLNSNRTSDIAATVDTNACPYIQTPPLAAGIGEISFWYRNWALSGNPAPTRLYIQKSIDSVIWSTVSELPIDSATNAADYRYFIGSIYDPNSHYVRISNNDTNVPVGRVCIDNILVTTPLASSLSLSNLVITPGIPLYSNIVKVAVDASRLFLVAPSNLTLATAYSTGSTYATMSSSSFPTIPMTCVSTNTMTFPQTYHYETASGIPPLPADTFVKYEARATFSSGYHPEVFSPTTNKSLTAAPTWYAPLPATGTAYYVVLSCPTGSVWFNEFNTDPSPDTRRYIELCGLNGADIRNWSIEIYSFQGATQGVYTATNNTLLVRSSTNGFGFWTLGNASTSPHDQLLATTLAQNGGFRLVRGPGILEQAICYGLNPASVITLTSRGFTYINTYVDDWNDAPVQLQGNSTNGFFWDNSSAGMYSPGSINYNQILVGVSQNSPPNIVSVSRDSTNIWIECTGVSSWVPTAQYSTNLLNTNGWTNITTTVWSTYPTLSTSNTYTIHFAPPTNNPVFLKVVATNAP